MQDKELIDAVASMEAKVKVFDKLRNALRIALPEGENGLKEYADSYLLKMPEFSHFRSRQSGSVRSHVP